MDSYEILAGLLGGLGILLIVTGIILFAFFIVYLIACWKLYKKAGKKGWECIIPVYSYLVLAEIAGLEWWWGLIAIANVLISFIGIDALSGIASIVSLLASINIYYNIALKFNKNKGTAVCAGVFSGIFVLIFGFSKNEVYNANIPVSKYGLFGHPENNYNNNGYNQNNFTQPQAPTNNYNGYGQNNGVSQQASFSPNNINQEYSFCKSCGTKIDKNSRFCPGCGRENI